MEIIPDADPPLRRMVSGPAVQTVLPAMHECIAIHSRLGLNVVADMVFMSSDLLIDCVRRLADLPVLYVGVRCPPEIILERRNVNPEQRHATGAEGKATARWWEREVERHHGCYDLEVDTSRLSPEDCAEQIRRRLEEGPLPSAFRHLAKQFELSAVK